MKERLYRALKGGSITGTFLTVLLMAVTFYTAYFNNYRVTILVNKYGEAHIEALFAVPLIVFCASFLVYDYFKEVF